MRLFLLHTVFCMALVCWFQTAVAQDISTHEVPDIEQSSDTASIKPELNILAGTSFLFLSGRGSILNHFVAPQLSWRLTPRFSLSTGAILGFTSFNSLNNSTDEVNPAVPSVALYPNLMATPYIAGEYQVNNKLSLTGRVFADVAQYNLGNSTGSLQLRNFGAAAGFNLKVNENTRIMAEIQWHNGNSLYPNLPNSHLNNQLLYRARPTMPHW